MKIKHFALIICLALYSCEGTDIGQEKGKPVKLSAEIEKTKTRAYNNAWEPGDAIGVYTKNAGESLATAALDENVKYVTNGTSNFEPASGGIVFPPDGTAIDFISYYPYQEEIIGFIFPVDVSDQSNQSNIDLLYSGNAVNASTGNPEVRLTFSHCLSKIVLNIEHENPSTDLSGLTVILANTSTKANFSLVNGTLGTATGTGNILAKMSPDGTFAEAIVLPTTNLAGMELWFIVSETEVYKYPLGSALHITSFDKSTKYTYNVTMGTDSEPVITTGSISTWTEGPSENIVPDRTGETPPDVDPPVDPESGNGTQENPYTIADAIAHQGENEVWVVGYIVGSAKNGTINQFIPGVTEESVVSNIVLADNRNETNKENLVSVELKDGPRRVALNLEDNPANFNRRVAIRGDLAEYVKGYGLRNIDDYEFIDP
jgi:hypothetical protein